ncbi:MAG: Hpt domain-containing protein [Magnetospirillum sp.]|nr:Hpt domain-containing protein [Magnetospirillum sp.]
MATDPADTFRQEAQDLFEQLEQALLDLEARPDDMELIGTAFRALHTLKGSGAMFGFDALSSFAHHLEAAFDQLRHGTLSPSPDLVALALAAKDHLRALLEGTAKSDDPQGARLLARLQDVVVPAGGRTPQPPAWPRRTTTAPRPGASAWTCRRAAWAPAPTRCCCSTSCANWACARRWPTPPRCRRWTRWIPPPCTCRGTWC